MERFAIDWRYNCHTNVHFLNNAVELFDKNNGMFNGHDAGVRGVRNNDRENYCITFFGINEKELNAVISLCNFGAYEIDEYKLRKTITLKPFPHEQTN